MYIRDNENNSNNLLKIVKQSINNVEQKFYQVEYLQASGSIGKQYRERVWCYEFYHRLREIKLFDNELIINGEIDKSGNNNFIDKINPDFIIHKQGSNDKNLCVIEVKLRLDYDGINKDFCSLTEMMNKHKYQNGIFILINHSFEELKNLFRDKEIKKCFNDNIKIWCKKSESDIIEEYLLSNLRIVR